jgi:hypothetical protein
MPTLLLMDWIAGMGDNPWAEKIYIFSARVTDKGCVLSLYVVILGRGDFTEENYFQSYGNAVWWLYNMYN